MNMEPGMEQRALRDDVRHFLAQKCRFDDRKSFLDFDAALARENWRAFGKNGWLRVGVPEEYGGVGGSVAETALIAHEFGRALAREPYLGCVMALQTLVTAASPQQRARLLPDLLSGQRRIALAYSEPQSRGMPEPITVKAERVPDGYVLHGRKTLVLGCVGADDIIVSAVAGEQPILLVLDAVSTGLTATALELHDGHQAAQLAFDGVFVPGDALLGKPESSLKSLRHGLVHGIVALSAELVGVMERAIELTADHLRTRIQFGVPIGKFQSLQHRLADMAAEMELSRSMLHVLLSAIMAGDEDAIQRAASQTKSLIGRAAKSICGQAIQMHGGIGMTEDCPIGHYFKRAVVADILLGSSDGHDSLRAEALEHTLKTAELRWYELLPVWWTAKQNA